MATDVTIPALGESITEATVGEVEIDGTDPSAPTQQEVEFAASRSL